MRMFSCRQLFDLLCYGKNQIVITVPHNGFLMCMSLDHQNSVRRVVLFLRYVIICIFVGSDVRLSSIKILKTCHSQMA